MLCTISTQSSPRHAAPLRKGLPDILNIKELYAGAVRRQQASSTAPGRLCICTTEFLAPSTPNKRERGCRSLPCSSKPKGGVPGHLSLWLSRNILELVRSTAALSQPRKDVGSLLPAGCGSKERCIDDSTFALEAYQSTLSASRARILHGFYVGLINTSRYGSRPMRAQGKFSREVLLPIVQELHYKNPALS